MTTLEEDLRRIEREDAANDALANLTRPQRVSPDAAIRAERQGAARGVPPSTVLTYPSIGRAAEADRAAPILRNSPALARWLAHPANADVARDDVHALSMWDSLQGVFANTPAGIFGHDLARFALNVPRVTREARERYAFGEDQVEMGALGYRARQATRGRANALTSTELQRLQQLQNRQEPEGNTFIIGPFAQQIPQLIGSAERGLTDSVREARNAWRSVMGDHSPLESPTAAAMAPMASVGAALSAVGGGVGGAIAFGNEQEVGQFYLEARRNGVPEEIAARRADEYGAWATGIEFASDAVLGPVIGGGGRAVTAIGRRGAALLARRAIEPIAERTTIRAVASRVAGEVIAYSIQQGGEEALQQAAQSIIREGALLESQGRANSGADAVSSLARDPERMQEALTEVLTSFWYGAQAGAPMALPSAAVNLGFGIADVRRARLAEEVWRAIGDGGTASNLRRRSTARFADAVDTLTANGPIESVTIDAERFVAYFQDQGQDPLAVADQLRGVGREALQQALDRGGELRIPTGTVAAQIAGTAAHQGLAPHFRIGADAMTPAEVQARAALGVDLERVLSETQRLQAEVADKRALEDEVYDRVLGQLEAAGAYIPEANRANARVFSSAVITMAQRAGVSPVALLDRIGLEVRGPFSDLADGEALQQTEPWRALMGTHPWINSPSRAQLVLMAREGASDKAIASVTGYTPIAARALLNRARGSGVDIAPRQESNDTANQSIAQNANRNARIYELRYRDGISTADIAKRVGLEEPVIRSILSQERKRRGLWQSAPKDLSTQEGRFDWLDQNVVTDREPGGEPGDTQHGFVLSDGTHIEASFGDDGNGATVIEWTFLDRIAEGLETEKLYAQTAEDHLTPQAWKELTATVVALIERDMSEHQRPAYVFTPYTDAHRRAYRALLGRFGTFGYSVVEDQGDIYLMHEGAKVGRNGRIVPQEGWEPNYAEQPDEPADIEDFVASVRALDPQRNSPGPLAAAQRAAARGRAAQSGEPGLRGEGGAQPQLFQSAPVFYSAVERVVADAKTQRAPGAQWWATISKAPGVKREELEWLGLEDFLRGQEGAISREDVLAFVRANGVRVEEVIYASRGASGPTAEQVARQRFDLEWAERDAVWEEWQYEDALNRAREKYRALPEDEQERYDNAEQYMEDNGGVWGQYTDDELELFKEEAWSTVRRDYEDDAGRELQEQSGDPTKWSSMTLPGGENYTELLLRLPQSARDLEAEAHNARIAGDHSAPTRAPQDTFRSSHWDAPNVLAHVRFNERVDSEGRRTLFLEEVQSDWHQSGRERGYKGIDTSGWTVVEGRSVSGNKTLVVRNKAGKDIFFAREDQYTPDQAMNLARAQEERNAVPNAPFKNNAWAALVLKRMIRWAAENDFEQIAWIPGTVKNGRSIPDGRATRLELSERGDMLYVNDPSGRNAYRLVEKNPSGDERTLSSVVGVDVAERLLAQDDANSSTSKRGAVRVLTGDFVLHNVQGWEFYDRILPNIANDLGTKYGARVGEARISTNTALGDAGKLRTRLQEVAASIETARSNGESSAYIRQQEREVETLTRELEIAVANTKTVHSLPITPEMREAAQSGLPLFQRGERASVIMPHLTDGGELRAALVNLTETRDLSSFLHESGHIWLEMLRMLAREAPDGSSLRQDWQTALDWFGVTDQQWEAFSLEEKRDFHEQWARGVEAYVFEGKAPSTALRDIFDAFKRWLSTVYRSIRDLNVELTPEIRGVFDRLLASDEAITEAQQAQGATNVMPRERFGGTDKQYERYLDNIARAREEAEAELAKRTVEAVYADRTRWWRSEEKRYRRTAEIMVDSEPARRAYDWLSSATWRHGDKPDGLTPFVLSRDALREDYPDITVSPEVAPMDERAVAALTANARAAAKGLRARQPLRLAAWVQQNGGIRDDGGEVMQAIGSHRARPGLISARGRSADDLALAAHEAGYFGVVARQGELFQEQPPVGQFGAVNTSSTAFRRWFKQSKVVDENGKPLRVIHGTTGDFDVFREDRANPESDLGARFYFTNETADAEANYAGLGPDLTQKIELEAERIAGETNREYNDPAVVAEARARFMAHDGATVPVYLSLQNPVEIGGPSETYLDYDSNYDEDTDEYGDPSGTLVDFINGLRDAAAQYDDADNVGDAIDEIAEEGMDGGISASRLMEILKKSEGLMYATDDQGRMVANEIVREAFERAGFDGYIDRTVNQKFGSERRVGQSMRGMNENTVHFVAFHANQIKSAISNTGEFSNDRRILFQSERPTEQEFINRLVADLRGEPVYTQEGEAQAGQRRVYEGWRDWFAERGVDINAPAKQLREQIQRIVGAPDPEIAVHPDVAASLITGALRTADPNAQGFASGEELLTALAALTDRNQAIRELTGRMMRDEYGDPFADGSIAEEARRTTHREAQSKVIETELDALARATGQAQRPLSRAARDLAEQQLRHMTVRQIRGYEWFLGNERRHAKAAMEALEKGDNFAALEAKRKQLVNFHLYALARRAADEMAVAQRYFRKFERNGVRENIDGDYLDQIDNLLDGFELKNITQKEEQRRVSLAAWALDMQERGLGDLVNVDVATIERAQQRPFAKLTLEEVRALRDTIRNIEHLGRLKDKLLEARDKRRIGDMIGEMNAAMERTGPVSATVRKNYTPTAFERLQDALRGAHAELSRPEFLLEYLDGEPMGPLWNGLFRPFAEAANRESVLMRRAVDGVNAIWANYTAAEKRRMFNKRIAMPELSVRGATSFTKAELLAIALNWGNEGNRQALLDGFDWTPEGVQAALNRTLDERDWRTVQAVWDLIATYRDDAFALEEDLTGLRPQAVEPTPIETPYGTVTGGYYPLKYDARRSNAVARDDERQTVQEMFAPLSSRPMTRKGHLIQRVGSGGRPVMLSLSVFSDHVRNVSHDIAYRRAVIDADRIVRDPRFAEEFERVAGQPAYRQLQPWIKSIATEAPDPTSFMMQIMRKARHNWSIAVMGYKLGVAFQQLSGIVNAIPHVGGIEIAAAVGRVLGRPDRIPAMAQFISERSEFMRTRATTFDRDAREVLAKMENTDPLFPIRHNAFAFIGMMDWAVSSVVWTAAYEKARAGNVVGVDRTDEASAIHYADRAVRTTQSAGLPQDLPAVMRDTEVKRLFTMVYGYFSVVYNEMSFRQVLGVRKGRINPVEFGANLALIWIIGPLLAMAVSGQLTERGDEDDEDRNNRVLRNLALGPFGTIPVLRDIVQTIGTPFDYQISPVGSAVNTTARAVNDAIDGRTLDSDSTARTAANAAGFVFGLPSAQAWISGDWLADLLEGEEEGFDPVEAAIADRR